MEAEPFSAVVDEPTIEPDQPTVAPRVAVELLRDHVQRGWRSRELVEAFIALVEAGTLSCRPTPS